MNINETPVRTSKSFNINNIRIDEAEVLNRVNEFKNIKIDIDSSKVKTENVKTPVNLKFGLGEELTKQVETESNQNFKFIVEENSDTVSKLYFNFDKDNNSLIENIEFTVNEEAKTTIIIKYEAPKDLEAYHNGIIKLIAKNKSQINVIIVNLLSDTGINLLAIENEIEEQANVKYTLVDFGANKSVTNYYSNIIGDLAQNDLNTIYIGKDNQNIDLNYIAELYGKKTNVNIEVQGALKDKARKNFKGTIDFRKGCKKAKGNENENCMLLSNTAKSIALPMLLCSEEDVEGAHSSSAGKVGEKELFYIMSRGFELKEAQKLLVRANFNNILNKIEDEEIKNIVLKEIDYRLN